jgi:2,3-bisphosphoglycerate-dependent phosphoglycerate mutase
MRKNISIFIFLVIISFTVQAQKTTKIWIVRHAEKETIDPKNSDPALTLEGEKRAEDLAKYLKKESIDYIFSTNYIRTKQTALPTAKENKIEISIYDTKDHSKLIQEIKSLAQGKNILIVGHSNTVLVLLEMLGALPPVPTLKDDDYDFIFKLSIKGEKIRLKSGHFGDKHHSTEIK